MVKASKTPGLQPLWARVLVAGAEVREAPAGEAAEPAPQPALAAETVHLPPRRARGARSARSARRGVWRRRGRPVEGAAGRARRLLHQLLSWNGAKSQRQFDPRINSDKNGHCEALLFVHYPTSLVNKGRSAAASPGARRMRMYSSSPSQAAWPAVAS